MNKVFEKIIEKLEEEKMSYFLTIANTGDEKLDCTYEQVGNALDKAIEIVKQEAEKYNNDQINQLAMMYAKNLVQFGVDITKIWDTAIQQTAALNQSYIRGRQDERDRFEQYNNGWISCSDRLPEANQMVLATEKDSEYVILCCYEFFEGYGYGFNGSNGNVIAWMELPQPYQPKGENYENS